MFSLRASEAGSVVRGLSRLFVGSVRNDGEQQPVVPGPLQVTTHTYTPSGGTNTAAADRLTALKVQPLSSRVYTSSK